MAEIIVSVLSVATLALSGTGVVFMLVKREVVAMCMLAGAYLSIIITLLAVSEISLEKGLATPFIGAWIIIVILLIPVIVLGCLKGGDYY